MIKKLKILLFAFLFVLFGFSFSIAYKIQPIWIDSSPSIVNNQYDVTFLKWGWVLTNYLWSAKSVLALDSNILFWRTPNWFPYIYSPSFQWFFDRYFSCDPFTWLDSTLNWCSSLPLNYSWSNSAEIGIFKNFFSKVVPWDYVYYNYINEDYVGWSLRYSEHWLEICFSSSEIWKSLCFRWWYCDSNSVYHCPWFLGDWKLTNSQNYSDLNFWNISYNSIWYAPWQNGYWWQFNWNTDWSIQWTINNQITWDYVYWTCTNKEILVLLETEGYNPYICYWWLDDFSLYDSSVSYNPIPWSWLSILQIWWDSSARAWNTFTDWFIFWNWLYKDTSNNYTAMWESYPAVYRTYFQLYNQYKWSVLDSRTILEYCNLKLSDIDLNTSAGGYFAPYCKTVNYEKQVWIRQSRLDWTIYSEGVYTGDVPISVNWWGVWNMSWLEIQSDWLKFIQDYFNTLKSKLSTNYSDWFRGVIPSYIIVFLLAIILFKFLSK